VRVIRNRPVPSKEFYDGWMKPAGLK
jgi:hypothetical protein